MLTTGEMIFVLALVFSGQAAHGQVLGQFTTAAVSAEGEGTVFMLAGNDAFLAGVAGRFKLTGISDLGIQLGLDHESGDPGETSYGGGVDVKLVLLERRERLPLGIAFDLATGWLGSSAHTRFDLDFGVLVSGAVPVSGSRPIEPYVTLVVEVESTRSKLQGVDHDWKSDTSTPVRAGVMIPLAKDGRLIVEMSLDGRDLFGAGFNLVF